MPDQPGPDPLEVASRGARQTRVLRISEALLALGNVGSVFALGAVRPSAYHAIWALSGLLAALTAYVYWSQPHAEGDQRRARGPSTPLIRPGLAFAGFVSLQLTGFPAGGTLSFADTSRGLAFLVAALAWHASAGVVLVDAGARRRMTALLSWVGFVLAFVGLAQLASGSWLIYGIFQPDAHSVHFGPFWNRNHYATYMLMLVPLALVNLERAGRRFSRVADRRRGWRSISVAFLGPEGTSLLRALLPPLATTVSLVATTSRGGLLSLVASLLVARRTLRRRSWLGWRLAFWLVVLGVLAVGVGALSLRFSQVADELRPGSHGRLSIWRASLAAMDGGWIAGWGYNTFALRVRDWIMYPSAHNQYLQMLVETGLIGLGIALWGAVATIRSVRHDGWLLAAIVGVLLHSVVEFSLQIPAVSLLFVTLAAWPSAASAPEA